MLILWELLPKPQKSPLEESKLQLLLLWPGLGGKERLPSLSTGPISTPPGQTLVVFDTLLVDLCGSSRYEKPRACFIVPLLWLTQQALVLTIFFPVGTCDLGKPVPFLLNK